MEQNLVLSFYTSTDLDASGKPGAGLYRGNVFMLGNFDECINISSNAHYCMMNNVEIKPYLFAEENSRNKNFYVSYFQFYISQLKKGFPTIESGNAFEYMIDFLQHHSMLVRLDFFNHCCPNHQTSRRFMLPSCY